MIIFDDDHSTNDRPCKTEATCYSYKMAYVNLCGNGYGPGNIPYGRLSRTEETTCDDDATTPTTLTSTSTVANTNEANEQLVFHLQCSLKLGAYNDDCSSSRRRSNPVDSKSVALSLVVQHEGSTITQRHNNIITGKPNSSLPTYSCLLLAIVYCF